MKKRPDLLCAAFNSRLEVCLAPATKSCTDHKGLQWFACDAPKHDTKIGSHNVKTELLE
jgi:hypothetical protein